MSFTLPCLFSTKTKDKSMNYSDMLKKKRENNEALTQEEIERFVADVKYAGEKKGKCVKDADLPIQKEQIGAMLMAIRIRGLDETETYNLTRAMIESGGKLSWPPEWKGSLVDKHSTGGVGDKVSLVLAPALAACGVKVPMISGRCLGHTGGTLDKLESIPGFQVEQSSDDMKKVLTEVGCCIVSQTSDLAPADKHLYLARDATSTVMEFGLITGSIISKKVVESPDSLVLDVKFGKGTFCKTVEEARTLAKIMVQTGNSFGVKTMALLTDMNSPLGMKIGNALEVEEAIQCLKGKGPPELTKLVKDLGGRLLVSVKKASNLDEAFSMIDKTLDDGTAIAKFAAMMKAQGVKKERADMLCGNDTDGFKDLIAKPVKELEANRSGIVHGIDAEICGEVVTNLARDGSGKVVRHDVGLTLTVCVGDKIEKSSTWVKIHDNQEVPNELVEKLSKAIDIKAVGDRLLEVIE